MSIRRPFVPQNGTEAPGIAQPQRIAPELQIHMIVFLGFKVGLDDAQAAGHAQVQDQPTRAEADQDVFPPAKYLCRAFPRNPGSKILRHEPAQPPLPYDRSRQNVIADEWFDAAAGNFYFGKFRHSGLPSFLSCTGNILNCQPSVLAVENEPLRARHRIAIIPFSCGFPESQAVTSGGLAHVARDRGRLRAADGHAAGRGGIRANTTGAG